MVDEGFPFAHCDPAMAARTSMCPARPQCSAADGAHYWRPQLFVSTTPRLKSPVSGTPEGVVAAAQPLLLASYLLQGVATRLTTDARLPTTTVGGARKLNTFGGEK
jgi:hypothetical protein